MQNSIQFVPVVSSSEGLGMKKWLGILSKEDLSDGPNKPHSTLSGLPSGHFTHIFIDEAGQALEPEAMMPLGFGAGNPDVQIVLAGDPKQLGPILMCKRARWGGLCLHVSG